MTQTANVQNAALHIFQSPRLLGQAAARAIAAEIRNRLASQETVRIIFAAAPSQAEMLSALATEANILWQRVEAFDMDEYIGLPAGAPQRFGNWLKRMFFDHVDLRDVRLIEPGSDATAASAAYATELSRARIDIVCLGIGMNGHLAFNDPPSDFHEPRDVRVVALSVESRTQQVKEGLFATLDDVPTHAITLSIPRLLRADKLFCCVSGDLKRDAVTQAFTGPVEPASPASILREHAGCTVFVDTAAAAGLALRYQ